MRRGMLTALAIASLVPTALDAQGTSVAGTWTLSVERLGVRLVLEQHKGAITGTLDWPHGDPVPLKGLFANDTLVFFGTAAGENFTVHVNATGTRKSDDTLAGTLTVHFDEFNHAHEIVRVRNQEIPWTAARGIRGVMHPRPPARTP